MSVYPPPGLPCAEPTGSAASLGAGAGRPRLSGPCPVGRPGDKGWARVLVLTCPVMCCVHLPPDPHPPRPKLPSPRAPPRKTPRWPVTGAVPHPIRDGGGGIRPRTRYGPRGLGPSQREASLSLAAAGLPAAVTVPAPTTVAARAPAAAPIPPAGLPATPTGACAVHVIQFVRCQIPHGVSLSYFARIRTLQGCSIHAHWDGNREAPYPCGPTLNAHLKETEDRKVSVIFLHSFGWF
jgi:hypothetical protein